MYSFEAIGTRYVLQCQLMGTLQHTLSRALSMQSSSISLSWKKWYVVFMAEFHAGSLIKRELYLVATNEYVSS